MLKSLVNTLWLIAGLALSGAAHAVGMGGINVASALGEPLKAEIELVAVGKAEKDRLIARLASPEAFKGAGMDYPSGLPGLKFQIGIRDSGEPYLSVTSTQPVNEPFVSVLIELSWSSGKLLREYTFLLDPPGFRAAQPAAAEVKPVLGRGEEAAAPRAPAMQMRSTAPLDEKGFVEAAPPAPARKPPERAPKSAESAAARMPAESAPARKAAEAGNVASGSIRVKRGDTLSQIAFDSKPSGVSLERMLLALYRANNDAFDGDNMNRLKAGKVLHMPEQADLGKLTQVEAVKEFRAHVSEWNEYRQKLAAASGAGQDRAPKQEASGKISASITEKSPAIKEPAKEVVRLSKGEAPGDKTVAGGNVKAMQERIHTLEEEAIAKGKALKESNERVAMLEKNIKEMQKLIELKGQPAQPAKPAPAKPDAAKSEVKAEPPKAETKPATPAPVAKTQPAAASAPAAAPAAKPQAAAASAPAAASAVTPAKPAAKQPKVVPPPPPPPSLLDDPLVLAGGAAALLALGGLGIALARRAKAGKTVKPGKKEAPESAPESGGEAPPFDGSATGRIVAPVVPSPETGDFTQGAAAAPAAHGQAEDVDPISEAELFLNFGRDAQAEEILKDALTKNPANNRIRLKLLSIYANRKDTNAFSVIARQIESSGDAQAWAQAAEMGRSLEPGNPMYGGAASAAAVAATASAAKAEPAAPGLDFDLGIGTPEAAAGNRETVAADAGEKSAGMTGLDFDLGAAEQGAAPAQEFASTLVLNSEQSRKAAADSSEVTVINTSDDLRAAQEAPMDFDITGNLGAPAAEAKTDLDDLVFDITSTSHPVINALEKDKEAKAVAASDDQTAAFTLDLPDIKPGSPSAQPAPKEAVDFDLGSINLDLGTPETPASSQASQAKDAHWHDVATKLDLAKAYQEMGDNAGAREILEEVMAEGDEQQRAVAEAIKQQLLA